MRKKNESDVNISGSFIVNETLLCFQVGEVVKMMEIELGSGWIFHKLCKVMVANFDFLI